MMLSYLLFELLAWCYTNDKDPLESLWSMNLPPPYNIPSPTHTSFSFKCMANKNFCSHITHCSFLKSPFLSKLLFYYQVLSCLHGFHDSNVDRTSQSTDLLPLTDHTINEKVSPKAPFPNLLCPQTNSKYDSALFTLSPNLLYRTDL